MPNDKYKLKNEILRRPPFGVGVIDGPSQMISREYVATTPARSAVSAVVEDASVRLCQFISAANSPNALKRGAPATGFEMAAHFAYAIDEVLGVDECRTYVLSFDKYAHVPARKRRVQERRDRAASNQAARNDDDRWLWDGVSSIAAAADVIPVWTQIASNRAARVRVMHDVIDQLLEAYRPPANCRLIVDVGERAPAIIETSADGRRLAPYDAPELRNEIGEGDISCQYYAQGLRRAGAMSLESSRSLRVAAPLGNAALFPSMNAQNDELSPNSYAPGSVVIRTVDTDLIVLAMLHHANEAADHEHTVYVASAAKIHREADSDAYCTAKEPNARPLYETYDSRALCEAVYELHKCRGDYARRLAVASFSAFCFATCNDYIERRRCLSHVIMYRAYRGFVERAHIQDSDEADAHENATDEEHSLDEGEPCTRRRATRSLVRLGNESLADAAAADADALREGRLCVERRAFRVFVKDCYRERVGGRRNATPISSVPWRELAKRIARSSKVPANHMPNDAELEEWRESVEWYLRYAIDHVYGVTPPEPCRNPK